MIEKIINNFFYTSNLGEFTYSALKVDIKKIRLFFSQSQNKVFLFCWCGFNRNHKPVVVGGKTVVKPFSNLNSTPNMGFILDGCPEHVAHVWWKIVYFRENKKSDFTTLSM